jgi:hypothetical protein
MKIQKNLLYVLGAVAVVGIIYYVARKSGKGTASFGKADGGSVKMQGGGGNAPAPAVQVEIPKPGVV